MDDARVDLSALTRARAKLAMLAELDLRPMLLDVAKVIVEDNRAGVLAGQDKHGGPLAPVRYRGGIAAKTARFRGKGSGKFGTTKFAPQGRNYATILPNNNLTSAQYRRLTGPPLAPRREQSRVITNFHAREPQRVDGNTWSVEAGWDEILDARGRPFFHFLLRTRPIDGLRPKGKAEAARIAREWIRYWWRNRT